MKYLLKMCFCFGLALTFVLGFTDIASHQLNQSVVEVNIELFASADDDSKKEQKEKEDKGKKRNKRKSFKPEQLMVN